LDNNKGNFQLNRFTTRENITNSYFGEGLLFDSHCTQLLMHVKLQPHTTDCERTLKLVQGGLYIYLRNVLQLYNEEWTPCRT